MCYLYRNRTTVPRFCRKRVTEAVLNYGDVIDGPGLSPLFLQKTEFISPSGDGCSLIIWSSCSAPVRCDSCILSYWFLSVIISMNPSHFCTYFVSNVRSPHHWGRGLATEIEIKYEWMNMSPEQWSSDTPAVFGSRHAEYEDRRASALVSVKEDMRRQSGWCLAGALRSHSRLTHGRCLLFWCPHRKLRQRDFR